MKHTWRAAKVYDAKGDTAKQWYVYFYFPHPHTGENQRFKVFDNINSFTRKRDRLQRARVVRDAYNELLAEGWNPFDNSLPHTKQPIRDALTAAIAGKVAMVRPKTQSTYRSYGGIMLKWLIDKKLDEKAVHKFSRKDALNCLDEIRDERNWGNKSYNNARTALRALFNWMVDQGMIETNPFSNIKDLPEKKHVQYVAFHKEEAQRLVKYMELQAPDLLFFCEFIYYCGLRPNEICQLKISDIYWDRARLLVRAEISKNKGQQYIHIPERFLHKMKVRKLHTFPGSYFVFARLPEGGYGPGEAEKSVWRNRFSEYFQRVKLACEIPKNRTLYSWKHYACIRAYEAGASVLAIKEQFRHSSMDQTYTYLYDLGCEIKEDYGRFIPEL